MATFDIRSEQVGAVTVLHLTGKLIIETTPQLREALQAALEEGEAKIVLEMSGMTTIDSSGVDELVSGYTTVTNRGGALALASIPAKIGDILVITNLISVFNVYDSQSDAVKGLS